ncbi:TonB-dependent receptor [Hymenobacter sp. BT18]|uniref:TonB-dependent receptor n=1 Tax=Hymenobacter sp. BT18 TaxID=2835648 RepID=UPI00143E5949|nr:TonB-dependent receptor [Hymenobacter sp. BT18]QIX61401.1 TonB-dependent receptor [Hymenobacter sp. BT18]
MRKIYSIWLFLLLLGVAQTALAQQDAIVSGLVQTEVGEPLPGATVFLKGTFVGTSTDRDGRFELRADFGGGPVVLSVSFIGYETKEVSLTSPDANLAVGLTPTVAFTNEVVVAASRVEEGILQAPVTIEKLNSQQIERIPTADIQAGLNHYKGIDVNSASLLMTSVSTRGFNSAKSERIIQLTDYFDTQSPSLNVNAGNLTGVPELDIESIEIIHGPASALYGANAFNGVLLLNTKDPFASEGLSVRLRGGQRSYLDGQLRFAKKLGEKFAFKVVGSYLTADDWLASNFSASSSKIERRNNPEGSGLGYDAVNRYGDVGGYTFTNNPADPNYATTPPSLRGKTIFMPGYDEKTLIGEDNKAKSLKIQPTISYLLTNNIKMTVGASVARGTASYQSSSRYRLRDFGTNQYHGEIKGTNWFLRGQSVQDFGGNSYDLTFLGAFLQTSTISPDGTGPTYAQRYYGTYLGTLKATGSIEQAKQAADNTQLQPSDPRFQELRSKIINDPTPGIGAKLSPSSLLNEGNAQYNFKFGDMTDLIVGGAYRKFRLGSNGNFFSDDAERIQNHELGGYTQLTHKLLEERLKLALAVRVDDFKNFDPAVSPRASVVYSAGERKQHNFRASYGRAFRSPTQLDQYVRIDLGQVRLQGNVDNGYQGYSLVNADGQPFGTTGADLSSFEMNAPALKLERLNTVEVGYKGILLEKLYMDINYYRSSYNDFIGAVRFIGNRDGSRPSPTQLNAEYQRVQQNPSGAPAFQDRTSNTRILQVWTNARQEVNTQGAAIGLTYYFNKALNLTTNYSLNILDDKDLPENFQTFFNTPKHKYNVGVNGIVVNNLNYAVNYRWAQGHLYEMPFAVGQLEDYSSLDASVGYTLSKLGTTLQLGGSNLLDQNNTQVYGGPNIGRLAYVGLLVNIK